MSDLFDTEIDSASKCGVGHALTLVAEGYAYCTTVRGVYYAWRMSPPRVSGWGYEAIIGLDGLPIDAWVSCYCPTKFEALAFIQADIDAHRSLPFDEEAERARLVAV